MEHIQAIVVFVSDFKRYLPLHGILQLLIYLIWVFLVQNQTTFLSNNCYFEIQTSINVNSIVYLTHYQTSNFAPLSKLKAFADNKLNSNPKIKFVSHGVKTSWKRK